MGVERSLSGEGVTGANARGRDRSRRQAAFALGRGRRRLRYADGFDGIRVVGRWPSGVAERRRAADGADQRARLVRPAVGDDPDVGAGCGAHLRYRRWGVMGRWAADTATRSRCTRRGTPKSRPGPLRPPVDETLHRPTCGEVRAAGRWLARPPRLTPACLTDPGAGPD